MTKYLGLVLAVATASIAATPALAADFLVINLGTLGGTLVAPTAISVGGVTVGYSRDGGGNIRGFSQPAGSRMSDLGSLGGTEVYARGIGSSGTIAGTSNLDPDDFTTHAFVYRNGSMTDLGTLLDQGSSYAYGVNAANQIVGYSETNSSTIGNAFLYADGQMSSLGTLGGDFSAAFALNDRGVVVGESSITGSENTKRAFVYQNGTMSSLGVLPGGRSSSALDINGNGVVVGWSETADGGGRRAFSYQNGAMLNLGTFGGGASEAYGINAAGQIVGTSQLRDATSAAFVYSGNGLINLNTLVNAPDWVLTSATAINDAGQIVGVGRFRGVTAAFRLDPNVAAAVPEPATWATMILGFALIGGALRHRQTSVRFAG